MMREILFRAKRYSGEWVYGYYAHQFGAHQILSRDGDEYQRESYHVNSETVGQYTGLTDKNGNKIFEGDTLKNTLDSSVSIVEWNEAHTAFTLKTRGTIYGFPRIGHDVYLIIGNIHDNPELIGDEENAEIH